MQYMYYQDTSSFLFLFDGITKILQFFQKKKHVQYKFCAQKKE